MCSTGCRERTLSPAEIEGIQMCFLRGIPELIRLHVDMRPDLYYGDTTKPKYRA